MAASSHALADLGLVDAGDLEREAHVVGDGHVRVERVVLEDHRDVAVLGGQVGDVAVADPDLAVVDLFEAGEHAQGGGLATPGGTDQDEELPVRDVDVELVDRRGVVARVDAGCLVELDCCHGVFAFLHRQERAGRSVVKVVRPGHRCPRWRQSVVRRGFWPHSGAFECPGVTRGDTGRSRRFFTELCCKFLHHNALPCCNFLLPSAHRQGRKDAPCAQQGDFMHKRAFGAAAVTGVAALLMSACGGGDSTATASASATPSGTTTTTTAAPSPTTTGAPSRDAAADLVIWADNDRAPILKKYAEEFGAEKRHQGRRPGRHRRSRELQGRHQRRQGPGRHRRRPRLAR